MLKMGFDVVAGGTIFSGVKTFEQAEEVQFFILFLFKVQLPFGTFKRSHFYKFCFFVILCLVYVKKILCKISYSGLNKN